MKGLHPFHCIISHFVKLMLACIATHMITLSFLKMDATNPKKAQKCA